MNRSIVNILSLYESQKAVKKSLSEGTQNFSKKNFLSHKIFPTTMSLKGLHSFQIMGAFYSHVTKYI